jgi:hypothetical protein
MGLIAKSQNEDFERPSNGLVHAVCVFVEDIGTHKGSYQGKETIRHQCVICFELAEKMKRGEYAGRPFMLSKFYTVSLGKKANLAKDLESWFGKEIPAETRAKGFDLKTLVGRNCTLNIITKTKQDGEYATIGGIMPPQAGRDIIAPVNTVPPAWIDELRKKSMEMTGEMDLNQEPPAEHADDAGLPF